MDIHEVIRVRRSVRAYADQPIADDQLERLLQAARWAPSARNLQPYRLVIVRDAERRRALAQAANEQEHVAQAPVVVAAVALEPRRVMTCRTPACPVDVA
ncbi:MAG: nitroreductase family protein, partial [Candidatus Latescibacterota bacterium]